MTYSPVYYKPVTTKAPKVVTTIPTYFSPSPVVYNPPVYKIPTKAPPNIVTTKVPTYSPKPVAFVDYSVPNYYSPPATTKPPAKIITTVDTILKQKYLQFDLVLVTMLVLQSPSSFMSEG